MHPDEGALPLDLYAAGRGAAYLATLLLVGVVAYALLLPRWRSSNHAQDLAERSLGRVARLSLLVATLLLLAHGARLFGQLRSFLDPAEPLTSDFLHATVFETAWGKAWLAQLIAGALAYALAGIAAMRPAHSALLLPPAALGAAFTSPLTGHALEHPWGALAGVTIHGIHLLGAGAWLGTLACLGVAALGAAQDRDAAEVARLIRAFSPLALAGAATVVLAGALLALAYVGTLGALTGTRYGRVVGLKILLLLAVAAVGRYNWKKLTPVLGTPAATRRLGRSVALELSLGLLLLGATAVLVALPAPKI